MTPWSPVIPPPLSRPKQNQPDTAIHCLAPDDKFKFVKSHKSVQIKIPQQQNASICLQSLQHQPT